MKKELLLILSFFSLFSLMAQPPVVHPSIGDEASSADGKIKVRLVGKRQNYGAGGETREPAINSPKSVNIHPNGKKYYVNSLEGGTTVVFETGTNRRIATISHNFGSESDHLWSEPSDFYPFTHYQRNNHFMGKPVESTFSHGGRYLWVPYYRRSFDINAQDPSAVAIIDTESDSIVRLMDCGPLPKMIATSPDGHYVAISHWGNNTVALIDISSSDPTAWHHSDMLVVDYVLPLNYPLDHSVDRDNGSGYALRGTVFTPDGKYLLVGCMGGGGGIAVIDMKERKYLGRVLGMMTNVRHLVIKSGWLYLSINGAGYVQRISLEKFIKAAQGMTNKRVTLTGWENCKVGKGARTIVISPSGRYIFAACNNESRLCVVDTRTMTMVASIAADSYPVGMDISDDGRYVYTTSQGRSHCGGNAVDIYEVTYAEPEPTGLSATPPPYGTPSNAPQEKNSLAEKKADAQQPASTDWKTASYAAAGTLLAAAAIGAGIYFYKKR